MPHIFNKAHKIEMGKYESLLINISFLNDLTGVEIPTGGATYHIAVKETKASTTTLISASGTTSLTLFESEIRTLSEGEYIYELSILTADDLWVELTQAPFILNFGSDV